jgi:hypothetical protein
MYDVNVVVGILGKWKHSLEPHFNSSSWATLHWIGVGVDAQAVARKGVNRTGNINSNSHSTLRILFTKGQH